MNGRALAIGSAAVCSGLLGGVLFAFSSFVMPALRRIPAPEGISAMQSINRQATTFAFGALIAITVLLSLGVGVQAALHRGEPGAAWVGLKTFEPADGLTSADHESGAQQPRSTSTRCAHRQNRPVTAPPAAELGPPEKLGASTQGTRSAADPLALGCDAECEVRMR